MLSSPRKRGPRRRLRKSSLGRRRTSLERWVPAFAGTATRCAAPSAERKIQRRPTRRSAAVLTAPGGGGGTGRGPKVLLRTSPTRRRTGAISHEGREPSLIAAFIRGSAKPQRCLGITKGYGRHPGTCRS